MSWSDVQLQILSIKILQYNMIKYIEYNSFFVHLYLFEKCNESVSVLMGWLIKAGIYIS